MAGHRLFAFLFLILLCLFGPVSVTSAQLPQRQPLEFEVEQSGWSLRSDAPVPLRVKSTCSSANIIEGNLEIRIIETGSGQPIASIQLVDQVYSPGRKSVEYLLPIQAFPIQSPLQIEFRFHSQTGEEFYSEGLLIPPSRRSFVCPVVCGKNGLDPDGKYGRLALESRCPKYALDTTLSPMVTLFPTIEAAEMPRDPLKYMPYDIVVVEPDGLFELQTQQITALESWVRGGGSLFLQIDEQDFSPEQHDFVYRLIAGDSGQLADEVDGTTLIPVIRGGKFTSLEYGLGQVVLTTSQSWKTADETTYRECFCDLWRLNPKQSRTVKQTGQLSFALIQLEYNSLLNNYQYMSLQQIQQQVQSQEYLRQQADQTMKNQLEATQVYDPMIIQYLERTLRRPQSDSPQIIMESLLPRDIRTVPIWLIGSILLAYVAAIGFGDYLILGRLKRRRWTWFTFPALTLMVSLLTIGTAKGYLSSNVEISSVEFRDVADDGSIVRIQRFDLHYRSSPGELITPLEQVVFTPISKGSLRANFATGAPAEPIDHQLISIRGVPTQKAQAFQSLDQWSPQLNRFVEFPRGRTSPLKLAPLKSGVAIDSHESLASISAQVKVAFPDAVYVGLLRDKGFVNPPGNTHQSWNQNDSDFTISWNLASCSQQPSARNPSVSQGIFNFVQQVSPSADSALCDLVVASPDHLVLCVAVREPSGVLAMYRYRIRLRSEGNLPLSDSP